MMKCGLSLGTDNLSPERESQTTSTQRSHFLANSRSSDERAAGFSSPPGGADQNGEKLRLLYRLHPELCEKEAVVISQLIDPFAQSRADAVAGAARRAQEDGMIELVRRLQTRGHFAR